MLAARQRLDLAHAATWRARRLREDLARSVTPTTLDGATGLLVAEDRRSLARAADDAERSARRHLAALHGTLDVLDQLAAGAAALAGVRRLGRSCAALDVEPAPEGAVALELAAHEEGRALAERLAVKAGALAALA